MQTNGAAAIAAVHPGFGLPLSARQVVSVSVPDADRVYRLAVPTKLSRIAFRQRWQELAGRIVEGEEVDRLFVAAVRTHVQQDQAEFLLGLYDRQKANAKPLGEALLARERAERGQKVAEGEEERAKAGEALAAAKAEVERLTLAAGEAVALAQLEDTIRVLDEDYRALKARYSACWELGMVAAAEIFTLGWEGAGGGFDRGREERLPASALEEIPDLHLSLIGSKVLQLLRPSARQEKNSASPSA